MRESGENTEHFQSICGKGRKIMDIMDIVNQQIAFLFEALTLKV